MVSDGVESRWILDADCQAGYCSVHTHIRSHCARRRNQFHAQSLGRSDGHLNSDGMMAAWLPKLS